MIILVALEKEIPTLHKNENVFTTGLGKVNAAFQTTKLILEQKPSLIVNFGTAGAVSNELDGLVECTGFIQRDMDCSPIGFDRFTTPFENEETLIVTPDLVCGTGDSFLTDSTGLKEAGIHVVDMEAYAIAKVCAKLDIPFRCFKYLSDKADENAGDDWNEFEHKKAEQLFIEQLTKL